MSDKVFVDTNVLIYAHDRSAGAKHVKARALLEELWTAATGVVSTQVLQEFYVNVTRKIPVPIPQAKAAVYVELYFAWPVVMPARTTILNAFGIERRYKLSFWDAMILSAALEAGAKKLLSEDLNAGQTINGLRIENPFV